LAQSAVPALTVKPLFYQRIHMVSFSINPFFQTRRSTRSASIATPLLRVSAYLAPEAAFLPSNFLTF
jgi:hypothetical protein